MRDAFYKSEGIISEGKGKEQKLAFSYSCTVILPHRQVLAKRKMLHLQRDGVKSRHISRPVFTTATLPKGSDWQWVQLCGFSPPSSSTKKATDTVTQAQACSPGKAHSVFF